MNYFIFRRPLNRIIIIMAPPRRPLAKKVSGAFLNQEERKQESADDMRCAIQFSIAYHSTFFDIGSLDKVIAPTPFWLFSARGAPRGRH